MNRCVPGTLRVIVYSHPTHTGIRAEQQCRYMNIMR